MDFNKIELTSAQQLLLNLVRILAPLVEGDSAPKRDMRFLRSHIFVPPSSQRETSQNYEVQRLTTLQKEMTKWVEPAKPTPQKKAEKGLSSPQPSVDSPISVVTQAKNLLVQVRLAIQMLSSSFNLDKPETKVFRDTMSRLKPLVDELVEAVGRTEMSSSDRRKPSLSFRPLPSSPREHLLKRTGPLPSLPAKEKPFPQKASHPSEKQQPPSFFKKSMLSEEGKSAPFAKLKGEGREKLVETQFLSPPSAEQKLPPSSAERTTLTGAPYLPEKPLFSKQKKKKKRKKELWPEKEED